MPAGSGGSITLRLAVAGSEEVKAALASLGPAGAKALREIEQAQAAPNAGMRALNAVGQDLTGTLQGLGGRAGFVGGALGAIGPAGLAAAAGIGALVVAGAKIADLAIKTSQWAEGVRRFSEMTGVSLKEVQAFDFIAQAAGIPVDKMRESVKGLGEQVGKLQDNLARGKNSPQIRVFEGILGTDDAKSTEEKLRQLGGVVPILGQIVQYAQKLSPTEREGLAAALKIDPEVLQALTEVKGGLSGLIGEMEHYHLVVSDQTIKDSADAAVKMRLLGAIMRAETNIAMADLAPAALAAAGGLVKVAGGIADILTGVQDATKPLLDFIAALHQIPGAGVGPQGQGVLIGPGQVVDGVVGGVASRIGSANAHIQSSLWRNMPFFGGIIGALDDLRARGAKIRAAQGAGAAQADPLDALLAQIRAQLEADQKNPPKLPPNAGGGGRHRAAPADPADEIASHAREMLGQSDNDLLEAKKSELAAQIAATKDEQVRAGLQTQLNALEDQQKDDESTRRIAANNQWLAEVKAKKGVTDADIKAAKLAVDAANAAEEEVRQRQKHVNTLRDQNTAAEKLADAEKAAAAAAKEQLQAQIDMLRSTLPLVQTLSQRRDVELAIFDAEEKQREAALQTVLANPKATEEEKATAQGQLDSLVDTSLLRRQDVINKNAGPWDQMLQKMTADTQDFGRVWQEDAVAGVDKFNSEIFDAQGRVQNLGQVVRSVLSDMLRQLEAYLLKQAEIGVFGNGQSGPGGQGGLFNVFASLFGGNGGGASGAASAADPSTFASVLDAVPFAGGGDVRGRGTATSDSVLIRASNHEKVMTAAANRMYGPVLDAMNAGRAIRLAHFAGGGPVGAPGGERLGGFFGDFHYHDQRDMSITAPGADSAALNRAIEAQKAWGKGEPARFVGYARAAGMIGRPVKRF